MQLWFNTTSLSLFTFLSTAYKCVRFDQLYNRFVYILWEYEKIDQYLSILCTHGITNFFLIVFSTSRLCDLCVEFFQIITNL